MEVLAPAGSLENLFASVESGADAVYLGMSSFNARAKAENFNKDNIKEMVRYCHLFGVRVYVTTNTLVKNSELNSFLEMANILVEAKVDAFIVQDMGVVKLLKDNFSNIVLHASTQMGVHNLDGAKVLEKLGFKRVVLSREAKLEDIKEIKQNTNLEIEYFVQGALCVAFSGNCYFSSLYGGNSGNRGQCLQFCRKLYSAKEAGQKGYLLSPRDLCLIKQLRELKTAGVCSLKIEGRMRRKSYVLQAVQSYRRAVDNLDSTLSLAEEVSKLQKVYSRGKFNERAYLDCGVADNVINPEYSNHRGKQIGETVWVKPFKDIYQIAIKSNQPIQKGDGLKFIRDGEERLSVGVGNVEEKQGNVYVIYSKYSAKKGDKVTLAVDFNFEASLQTAQKKLPIEVEFVAKKNQTAKLKFKYNHCEVLVESSEVLAEAKTSPLNAKTAKSQIEKLTDTNFVLELFNCEIENVFMAKSVLNDLRRRAVSELENAIIASNEKDIKTAKKSKQIDYKNLYDETVVKDNKLLILINEFTDLKTLLGLELDYDLIYSPTVYNLGVATDVETIKNKAKNSKIYLNLPTVANGLDVKILDEILNSLSAEIGVVANNLWGLKYGEVREVFIGQFLNVFNNLAVAQYKKLGFKNIIISPEVYRGDITDSDTLYQYSFGKFPVMTLCHCPYKTVKANTCQNCQYNPPLTYVDEMKNDFSIRRVKISNCYFELLSSKFINNLSFNNLGQLVDVRELPNLDLANLVNFLSQKEELNLSSKQSYGWYNQKIK